MAIQTSDPNILMPVAYDIAWTIFAGLVLAAISMAVLVLVRRVASAGLTAGESSAHLPRTAAAARRHAGLTSAVALTCGAVAGVVCLPVIGAMTSGLTEGLVLGIAPLLAGGLFLAVHAVGEVTWPRPTGSVRRASLAPRTVRDIASIRRRRLTWVWTGLIILVAVAGGFTASSDGRSVSRLTGPATSAGAGPYPGWYYGVPLVVAALLLLAGTEGVLRLVARRPAVMGVSGDWDLAMRRLSCHRVLRGVQLPLALAAAGMLVFGGSAAMRVGVTAGALALVAAAAICVYSLIVLFQPGTPPGPASAPFRRAAPSPDAPGVPTRG